VRETRRPGRSRSPRGGILWALSAATAIAAGSCNIVQGFRDAGDTLFPEVKTYLEAPGFRLVSGNYRGMSLVASSDLFLIARPADDENTSLYSMRYADPKPCELKDVGRYWAGGSEGLGRSYIAYFPGGQSSGTLSFADEKCRRAAFTLPAAELPPVAMIEPRVPAAPGSPPRRSLILRSESNLVALAGNTESSELLLERAGGVLSGVGPGFFVHHLEKDTDISKVAAFDENWEPLGTFGDGVVAWGITGGKLFVEDSGGIFHVTPSSSAAQGFMVERFADGACQLGFPAPDQRWVAMYSPCDEEKLVLWDDGEKEFVDLGFEAVPWLLRLVTPKKTSRPDPSKDPLWVFFLRDLQNTGLGTLVARNLEGEELVLGANAALERASVNEDDKYGYALTNIVGDTGDLVRWEPSGTTETLASGVLRDSTGVAWAPLIVDWDGTSGTAAHLVEGRLERVLGRVPRRHFAYTNLHGRVALFNDYDGESGTLSIGSPVCPEGASDCTDKYYAPTPIARNVHHPRHDFLDKDEDFLPGIAYLADYDVDTETGRFEYRNLELGFTSVINEGVADFMYAGNGLLYSVPYGDGAGIWLARAK
jgi:hypothetical protein